MIAETRFSKLRRSADGFYVAVPAGLATGYSIATRTPEDFLAYPLIGAGWLYAVIAAWMFLNFSRKPPKARSNQLSAQRWFLYIVAAPAISVVVALIYYGVGVALKDFYLWAIRPANRLHTALFVLGFAAIAVGAVLFMFRLRLRFAYGFTESVVGLVVAVSKLSEDLSAKAALSANTYIVVLTAGVYLMVRGFDNMHTGLTKDPVDPFIKWLRAWLFSPTIEAVVKQEKSRKNSSLEVHVSVLNKVEHSPHLSAQSQSPETLGPQASPDAAGLPGRAEALPSPSPTPPRHPESS